MYSNVTSFLRRWFGRRCTCQLQKLRCQSLHLGLTAKQMGASIHGFKKNGGFTVPQFNSSWWFDLLDAIWMLFHTFIRYLNSGKACETTWKALGFIIWWSSIQYCRKDDGWQNWPKSRAGQWEFVPRRIPTLINGVAYWTPQNGWFIVTPQKIEPWFIALFLQVCTCPSFLVVAIILKMTKWFKSLCPGCYPNGLTASSSALASALRGSSKVSPGLSPENTKSKQSKLRYKITCLGTWSPIILIDFSYLRVEQTSKRPIPQLLREKSDRHGVCGSQIYGSQLVRLGQPLYIAGHVP